MTEIGDAFREQRTMLGLSQQHVASLVGIERSRYIRIERGVLPGTIEELDLIAAVLGLELAMRAYPAGPAVRDAPSMARLKSFLAHVRAPLAFRLEVSLPSVEARYEQRAWDAVLFGGGKRTACGLEMRLRDVQAMKRRHDLKRRDDPTEQFLLLIADTRHNRQVVAEYSELFKDLPRLRPSDVYRALERGQHPQTGVLFV